MSADTPPCVVFFATSQVEVTVPPGVVLLDVGEANGVALDSLCRGGTCGTCAVRLRSGTPTIVTLKALPAHKRQAGWILTCSASSTAGQRIVLDA